MAKKAGYPGSSTIIKTGRSHASYERSAVSRQQQNHSAEAWRFEKLQNYLDSIAISI
jgi:hypothetical protein